LSTPGSTGRKTRTKAEVVGKIIGVLLVVLVLGAVFYYVLIPTGTEIYREGNSLYGILDNTTTDNQVVGAPPANYDEQLALIFTSNYQSLAYNATVSAQNDTYGYGPAYLLNGLSNTGDWYQVGVSYNWGQSGGHLRGFSFIYEVWAPNAKSIYPSSGGSGSLQMSVKNGDLVLLQIYLSGSSVIMSAHDWNTSSSQQVSYSSVGASSFVGLSGAPQEQGYFTGLMTEWYHAEPYYGKGGQATYSSNVPSNSGESPTGYMMIEEFNAVTKVQVFFQYTQASFSTAYCVIFVGQKDNCGKPPLQPFSYEGATEGSSLYEFATG